MRIKTKKKVTTENFQLKPFLVSDLRASFKKTPMYSEALNNAKEEYFEESKNGKPMRRVHYVCAECGRRFREHVIIKDGQTPADAGIILPEKSAQHKKKKFKMIAVDHVEPIIDPKIGFTNWDDYINRLYFGKLQILCNYPGMMDGVESCHSIKTKAERAELADTKRSQKPETKKRKKS